VFGLVVCDFAECCFLMVFIIVLRFTCMVFSLFLFNCFIFNFESFRYCRWVFVCCLYICFVLFRLRVSLWVCIGVILGGLVWTYDMIFAGILIVLSLF